MVRGADSGRLGPGRRLGLSLLVYLFERRGQSTVYSRSFRTSALGVFCCNFVVSPLTRLSRWVGSRGLVRIRPPVNVGDVLFCHAAVVISLVALTSYR